MTQISVGDIVNYVIWGDMLDYHDKLSNGAKPVDPQERSGLIVNITEEDGTKIFWILDEGQVEKIPSFLAHLAKPEEFV